MSDMQRKLRVKDKNFGYKGYFTRFEIDDNFISQYQVRKVGAFYQREFWIPAGDPEEFNRRICGRIEVIKIFEQGDK